MEKINENEVPENAADSAVDQSRRNFLRGALAVGAAAIAGGAAPEAEARGVGYVAHHETLLEQEIAPFEAFIRSNNNEIRVLSSATDENLAQTNKADQPMGAMAKSTIVGAIGSGATAAAWGAFAPSEAYENGSDTPDRIVGGLAGAIYGAVPGAVVGGITGSAIEAFDGDGHKQYLALLNSHFIRAKREKGEKVTREDIPAEIQRLLAENTESLNEIKKVYQKYTGQ